LTKEERNKFHLPRKFYRKDYEAIDAFQGERVINTLIHVQDLQVEGDVNYTTPILNSKTQKDYNYIKLPCLMEDFLGDEHPTPQ
jgi:phosphoglucomutase